MAQYLPLPDGTYYPVAEGEDPKVAWQRAMQKYPEAFGGGEAAPQPKSGFMPALKAGVSSLKSDVAALAGRTGIMGLPEAEKYIAEQEKYQKATYKPTEEGWMEAPLTKIGELAGGSAAYMAAPIAAGAAAAALPLTGTAATLAGLGATGLASAAQFTGSNLARQMDTGKKLGETDIGAAAVAALPQAALDTISLRMIPGMGKLFEKAGLNISEEAAKNLAKEGLKKTAADYALSTGKTMGVEGLTEAGQQVFERMQAGLNITDPDARKEYFDNFLGGAVLGGILAPVGRRVERGGEQARFDKQQREEQKKQADEAKVAQDKLDAETLAKKQTPEYALQAQQAYLDAEQRKKDLKAKIHKAPKGQELTEDQKLDNQETSLALADHKTVLNNAAKEFRQFRQFLPAAAPEAIKDTTQLEQPEMFGAPAAPKAPELDMFGKPVERAAPEPEAEDQGNLQLQIRGLSDYLDQLRAQNAKIPVTDTDAKIAIGEKYSSIKKMLTEVQKYVPPEVDTTAITTKIADLTKKMSKADADGDVDISARHATKIKELQSQLATSPTAPSPQQEMEMQPFKSTVTGDRQLAIRPQYAANLNLGAEEQEADVAAQQAQAEAQYRALGKERDDTVKVGLETKALQRIGERTPAFTSPQFDMFEGEPETGASAAINQVKKGLTGGEELPTGPESIEKNRSVIEASAALQKANASGDAKAIQEAMAALNAAFKARPTGQTPIQRGGPAPFNLYARKEGTGEPATAASLRDRVNQLQLRDDLSDEAYAFLRRADANIGEKDTSIGNQASLFTMLDEQLGKIERDEEGVVRPGTYVSEQQRGGEGQGTMAQALREIGAAKPSSVTALPGSITNPTKVEKVESSLVGKKYNLSRSDAAKALAIAKRAKYEAGIAEGLSQANAANRAKLVTQEEAEIYQRGLTGAEPTAVRERVRKELPASTQLGASKGVKPLSLPRELEEHLRVKEELAQEEGKQRPLFQEEEVTGKALVRATPGMFQRFLDSKTAQEMRDREQEIKEQTKQLDVAKKVQVSITELQERLKELTARYETAQVAKNIMASNAQADAAIAQYEKLRDKDPYFNSILLLDSESKSGEYARLQAEIVELTRIVGALPAQIQTTRAIILKESANAGTPSEALKANRAKIEILQRQQKVLTEALAKLESLQATAASVKAAKDHVDAMLSVIVAKRALENLRGREVSREQVVNAQTDLQTAMLARRAAEENSKAKDTMRDVRDFSYATLRKRQELSEQRTRAWNVLSQLPGTQYRALTPEERGVFATANPDEVKEALEYERHLAGMNVQSLKMELGQLDKESQALEAKIKAAKAKSESFLTPPVKPVSFADMIGPIDGPARPNGPHEQISIEDAKLLRQMVQKIIEQGLQTGKTREQIIAQIDGVAKGGIRPVGFSRINDYLTAQGVKEATLTGKKKSRKKETPPLTQGLVHAKEAQMYSLANIIREKHGSGDLAGVAKLRKQYLTLKKEVEAFNAAKTTTGPAGSSLVMYGEKGSIFTKPAFVGVEGFIKKQAELADKREALEIELNRKEAAMTPISKGARGQAAPREVATTRAAEQAEIDLVVEATQAADVSREKIETLEALYKEEAQAGNAKKAQAIAQDIIKERAELAEAEKNMGRAQRRYAAQRKVAGEPSKLRTGTAESKAVPGVTKQTITEQRVEPKVSTGEIITSANEMAAEKIAAGKPLTKKEVKELTLKQQQALQAAAFDRVQTTASQVAEAQARVDAIAQTFKDYAAGRRATPIKTEVVQKAQDDLAEFQKANQIARQQAGILEDVGAVSKTEQAAEEVPKVKESDISGAAGEIEEEGMQRGTSGPNDTPLSEQNISRLRNGDVRGALTHIANTSENQVARRVAGKIQAILNENGVSSRLVDKTTSSNPNAPGMISQDGKRILLNERTGLSEESLIHEGVHAATMFELDKPDEKLTPDQRVAKQGLTKMMNQVKAAKDFDNDVIKDGDIHEFVAEGNASKAVQKYMRSQTFDNRSMWQKFKEFLLRLVGVKVPPSPSMLDKFLDMSEQFMRAKEEGAPDMLAPKMRKANYTSDDDLSKLAKDIVATKQGFFEKLGGEKMLQFEMLVADMRAGLRKAMEAGAKQMGDTRLFQQAMMSVTKADQKMPLVLTALSNGPLETYTDEKGFKGVRTTNENSAKEIFAAISEIPDSYGNGEAKMALATAYMIAQRAANKGLTKLDLGALGVTEEKLAAAMRQVEADPELKKALERTRSLYNKFNAGMIRFLASTGAITQKEADGFLKEGDYVPYYRVNANGLAQLVLGAEKTITIGDIRYQPHLAQLKGGETKILSLDESLPRNTMLLVEKAMTNMATRNVGYALYSVGKGNGEVNERTGKAGDLMPIHKGDGPADPGVIRWNQEPDRNDPKDTGKRWLRVQTSDTVLGGIPAEIIVKSLEGAHLTLPGFLKLGAIAGDFLRAGVTRTPVYLLRQLFRDPFAAAATAGLDYGPIKAIYKAGNEYLKMNTGQSETAAKLIEKGLIQSGIFTGDPDDISKFALQLASGKDMGVMDKFFAMADNQAMKADAATRVLVYDNAIKNGLSEVEADMAVMESMNFHKRGLSPTVQYASRMIPFFNSQIQGLNVLFKAATGNMPFNEQLRIKQKFQNNAMMLMGMGLVYAMMMEDDEYFKNAKPKDKYSNFFVHIPGVDEPLKLPIPYEFGWFFSAAVATVDAMKAETDGPQQLRALREMFIGAIPGSSNAFVVPQIIKPIAEVWTNKSFFSGQPLESQRLRKLDPEARYYDTTTEIAKEISKLIPILSPIQIEHIVTGYLGSLPLMAAAATDGLFKGEEAAETPTRRLSQMPMIGSSFQRKYGGEDADVVYKLATEALQAKATFNEYKNTGKLNEAKEYFQEHRAELAVAPMALQYEKFMGNLRKQEQIIRQSSMPADKKRERIDLLDKQRQLQSERYAQAIKRAEAAIGRTTPQ